MNGNNNNNNNMRSRRNYSTNNNEFDMFFNMMQHMEDHHQHKLNQLRTQINALKTQKKSTTKVIHIE